MRRRSLLAAGVVAASSAVTGVVSGPPGDDGLLAAAKRGERTRETESILPGTDHETTLYAVDAPGDGPTVMVFGGIHGDERNGVAVAREVADWRPDAGRLVVVPETNRAAVEANRRAGPDGDLNRSFPPDGGPQGDLARGIWDAVERHDPDVVLDLHRSLGIFGVHSRYVGQAIFYTPDAHGEALADYLDEVSVPWYAPLHGFAATETYGGGSLLYHEANRELGSIGYLFESTSFLLDRKAMNRQTRLAAAKVLELHGLLTPEGS